MHNRLEPGVLLVAPLTRTFVVATMNGKRILSSRHNCPTHLYTHSQTIVPSSDDRILILGRSKVGGYTSHRWYLVHLPWCKHANGHRAQKLNLADLDAEVRLQLVSVARSLDET